MIYAVETYLVALFVSDYTVYALHNAVGHSAAAKAVKLCAQPHHLRKRYGIYRNTCYIAVEHALDPRRILCGDARRVDIRRLCRMSAPALNDHKQQHRSVRDKHGTELEYRSDALCGRCGKRCIVRHRAHQSRSTVEYLVELCLSCTDELLQLCKLARRHAVAVH